MNFSESDATAEPTQDEAPEAPAQVSCFCCSIGEHLFALEARYFCEVISQAIVAPLPGVVEHLLGLCNLRGTLVPIYQLHQALGKPLPRQIFVLVVGQGDKSLGLTIDHLPIAQQLTEGTDTDPISDKYLADLLAQLPHRILFHKKSPAYCLDAAQLGPALRDLTLPNSTIDSH